MNDTKNIFIAWISSVTTVLATAETGKWVTAFSAVLLPFLFFTLGKTIDVLLQFYFRRRDNAIKRDQ